MSILGFALSLKMDRLIFNLHYWKFNRLIIENLWYFKINWKKIVEKYSDFMEMLSLGLGFAL